MSAEFGSRWWSSRYSWPARISRCANLSDGKITSYRFPAASLATMLSIESKLDSTTSTPYSAPNPARTSGSTTSAQLK